MENKAQRVNILKRLRFMYSLKFKYSSFSEWYIIYIIYMPALIYVTVELRRLGWKLVREQNQLCRLARRNQPARQKKRILKKFLRRKILMWLIKLFQLFIKRLKVDIILYCYIYIVAKRIFSEWLARCTVATLPLSDSRTRRRVSSVFYMQIIRVMKYFQVPYSS